MANDSRLSPELRRWRWMVWSEDGPPGPAKRSILQVLFDFLASSPEREIFPSVETIAVKSGITKKHVIRHLAELEADGWISRKVRGSSGQGWKRHAYELHWPRGFSPKADEWLSEVERKRLDARDEHRMSEGWQPEDETEARRRAAKGDTAAEAWLEEEERKMQAEVVERAELERRRERARLQRQLEQVPDEVDPVAWREYVEYRNRVDPMSDDAARQAAGRLWRLDPEEARQRVRSVIKRGGYGLPARYR